MAYKNIKLNCDLGEELYDNSIDARVMPYIDMANIACGGHAGDLQSMSKTLLLALKNKVTIGAHPSYPDRENFGRKTVDLEPHELHDCLFSQVSDLVSVCSSHGGAVNYIKPHGALYHDCLNKPPVLDGVLKIAQVFKMPLMLLRSPENSSSLNRLTKTAQNYSVELIWEGFADRQYSDEGFLLNRTYQHAVHKNLEQIVNQAQNFICKQGVYSSTERWLKIDCDSLCVHGDTPLAFDALKSIRLFLNDQNNVPTSL